jgi:hypothetical protein
MSETIAPVLTGAGMERLMATLRDVPPPAWIALDRYHGGPRACLGRACPVVCRCDLDNARFAGMREAFRLLLGSPELAGALALELRADDARTDGEDEAQTQARYEAEAAYLAHLYEAATEEATR